jgi:hypothetical protein
MSTADDIDPKAAALEYYRAAVERRAPLYVPATVWLRSPVRGDFPVGHNLVARAGAHACTSNRWGALSVTADNGEPLGIKPAEFEPLTWQHNVGHHAEGA